MTDLALRIIHYLNKNRGGASGAAIAKDSGVSVNTARKELQSLKELVTEHGLEIEAKTSAGYRLITVDEERAKPFLRQVASQIKNPLFGKQTSQEYKVNYIIRRLLVSEKRIPLEFLCDELFYSVSSVRRELKIIAARLEPFHLSLDLKRGYGYTIQGNEWGKRLCLLAQHKMFVNLEQSYQDLEPEFVRLFGIGDEKVRRIRHTVRDAIYESDILSFKMIDLPVLMNYIPLIGNRKLHASEIVISDEQNTAIQMSGIRAEAERILSAVRRDVPVDKREIDTYAMLLLSHRNVTDISQLKKKELTVLREEMVEIGKLLERRVKLSDSVADAEEDSFCCCWYGIRSKLIFSVIPDEENIREFQLPNPIAEDLCVDLAKYIEQKYDAHVPMRQTAPMYYVFLRLLFRQFGNAFRYRAAVVSAYGFQYADYCAQMIRREYGFYLKEVTAMEYTQIQNDVLDGVDLLINDLKSDIVERLMREHKNLTSLWMGFVVPGKRNIRKLDEWLEGKKEEELAALTFEGELSVGSVDELPLAVVEDLKGTLEKRVGFAKIGRSAGDAVNGDGTNQNGGNAGKRDTATRMEKNLIDWNAIVEDLSNRLYYEALQLRGDVLFLTARVPDTLVGIRSYTLDNELQWDGKRRNRIICCLYNDHDFRKMLRMEEILQEMVRR